MLEVMHESIDSVTADRVAGGLLLGPDDVPICTMCFEIIELDSEYRIDKFYGSRYRRYLCELCNVAVEVPLDALEITWRETNDQ